MHSFSSLQPPYNCYLTYQRRQGDPLRVYMDLEAGRKKSGYEDIFISYHAKDDVQSTYAGALFHNNRNYHLSPFKNNVSEMPLCSFNFPVQYSIIEHNDFYYSFLLSACYSLPRFVNL